MFTEQVGWTSTYNARYAKGFWNPLMRITNTFVTITLIRNSVIFFFEESRKVITLFLSFFLYGSSWISTPRILTNRLVYVTKFRRTAYYSDDRLLSWNFLFYFCTFHHRRFCFPIPYYVIIDCLKTRGYLFLPTAQVINLFLSLSY